MDIVKRKIAYVYLQYELITCLYMFEPWEKIFLNFSFFVIASLLCYSTYVYLPPCTVSLVSHPLKTIFAHNAAAQGST